MRKYYPVPKAYSDDIPDTAAEGESEKPKSRRFGPPVVRFSEVEEAVAGTKG